MNKLRSLGLECWVKDYEEFHDSEVDSDREVEGRDEEVSFSCFKFLRNRF